MVPFDVGILLWLLWRDDVGQDAQAQQKAAQGRGEVASTTTAYPAGIVIKGEHGWQAVLAQEVHHRQKSRFPHGNPHEPAR